MMYIVFCSMALCTSALRVYTNEKPKANLMPKATQIIDKALVATEEQLSEVTKFADAYAAEESKTYRAANAKVKQEELEDGVLAFVPGMHPKRVELVKSNIAWLKEQNVNFECYIYKYQNNSLPDSEFAPCKVVSNPHGRWMDHFTMVPLSATKKKYVLHLMDGVKAAKVDLKRMMHTMEENKLVHLAPALYGKKKFDQMVAHKGFGREVNYIEYHMDLFTRDNFACLQDIIDTKDGKYARNSMGWGIDQAMPIVCPGKMGIIDVMKAEKQAKGTYEMNTARIEKGRWAASHGFNLPPLGLGGDKFSPLKGEVLADDLQCDGIHTNCWDTLPKNGMQHDKVIAFSGDETETLVED